MGDKRTLLAFLIIGLILYLMPRYYELVGLAPPRQDDETVDPVEVAAETSPMEAPRASESGLDHRAPGSARESVTDSTATAHPAIAPPPPVADRVIAASKREVQDARHVRVITPRQELTFSSMGGVLTSAKLYDYVGRGDRPVELIPEGGTGLAVVLRSEAGADEDLGDVYLDLSGVPFTIDVDELLLADGEEGTLRLRAELGPGQYLEKRLRFEADQFGFDLELAYDGFSDEILAEVGWTEGIALAEEDPQVDIEAMRAMVYLNDLDQIEGDEDAPEHLDERGQIWWMGIRNKYFLCALIPKTEGHHRVRLSAQATGAAPYRLFEASMGTRMKRGADTLKYVTYVGPLDIEALRRYEVNLERAMDLGWPVIRDISKVILVLLVAVHAFVPNYGVVIILFAIGVKLLVYPLTHKSYESAARMQELQPKIAALKEKHKNDNQRLSQETMKLYREEGVNPLGGCLPLLLQMPIFIGLYQAFRNTIELRRAPFGLWIQDLAQPEFIDVAGFELHVLPILMAAAMFFQSRMTMKDPKQAAMVYVMPLVMVFIMWQFASGLVLYWTVFNVLQIGQQYLTNHLKAKRQQAPPSPG